MKHYLVLSIIIIGLMGCSAPVKHGAEFDDHNVDNIVKGETTKQQLIEWFGEPGIKSTISENEEKWVYSFTRGKVTSGIFRTKSDITTKILDLYLKEDIVINFAYSERQDEI